MDAEQAADAEVQARLGGAQTSRASTPSAPSCRQKRRLHAPRLDLVCVVAEGAGVSCRLRDPSAASGGAAHALPRGLAEEHAAHEREISHHAAMVAIGKVAATVERKVLRVLHLFPDMTRSLLSTMAAPVAGVDPTHNVQLGTWAVIDSIVYFSTEFVEGQDVMPDRIASFNLETEQWRPMMQGPRRGYESRNMLCCSLVLGTNMVNIRCALCWCWMMGG
ncbi:unnamed protein product [Urochloa humidicola]